MKILIIIINIIFILCLLPSLGAAMMSPMIMGIARNNEQMFVGILGMIAVVLFPLIIVFAQYHSWKYYSANNLKFSLYYACAPLVLVVLLLLFLLFAWLLGWVSINE